MIWARTEFARRWMQLDPEPCELGFVTVDGKNSVWAGPSQDPLVTRYMPHEMTCEKRVRTR